METIMIISIGATIISLILYLTLCLGLNRNPLNPFKDRTPKLIGWTIQDDALNNEKEQ